MNFVTVHMAHGVRALAYLVMITILIPMMWRKRMVMLMAQAKLC